MNVPARTARDAMKRSRRSGWNEEAAGVGHEGKHRPAHLPSFRMRRLDSRVFYNAQTEVKDELEGWEVEFSLQDDRTAGQSRRKRQRRAASRCRTSDERTELCKRASGGSATDESRDRRGSRSPLNTVTIRTAPLLSSPIVPNAAQRRCRAATSVQSPALFRSAHPQLQLL